MASKKRLLKKKSFILSKFWNFKLEPLQRMTVQVLLPTPLIKFKFDFWVNNSFCTSKSNEIGFVPSS